MSTTTSAEDLTATITEGSYSNDITFTGTSIKLPVIVNANGEKTVSLSGKNITIDMELQSTSPKNFYVFHANDRSTINLGSNESNTKTTIVIDGKGLADLSQVYAIATTNIRGSGPSVVDINGESLNITSSLPDRVWGAAITATTNNTAAQPGSVVNVDTNATITVDGAKNYGLQAYSAGSINVNKNLALVAEGSSTTAISARGKGKVSINADSEGNVVDANNIVKISGDISFDISGGDPVDGIVTINLTNSQSYWEGSAKYAINVSGKEPADVKDKVVNQHTLNVSLANGAVWNATPIEQLAKGDDKNALEAHLYFAPVSQLTLDGGIVNVHNEGQPVVVNKLTGSGTINVAASKQDDGKISTGSLVVGEYSELKLIEGNGLALVEEGLKPTENGAEGAKLAVNYTGINSDDLSTEEFKQLAQTSVVASGATQTQKVAEGLINGEMVQTVNANGEVTSSQVSVNTVNQSLRDIGAVTFLGFRTTINDLDKRLGDLRSYSGENGGWVRYLGGQNRYGARNMKLNYNGFQAGFDHRFGEFYAGAAFGYTKGNGHLHNGSSDNDNWNFGLYGGWLGEKGQFVDVIVKRHRFKNEFNLHNTSGVSTNGSYHNWATSFSVETGWRLQCPSNGFYVEPQAEFMFGRMENGSFKTSQGVKVKQDSVNTTVGRLGVATGYTLPDNKGNAYIKASVLHDWSAKVKGSMSKDGLKTSYRDDLSGTWAEFSVGGTYNATKNISAYGEFQTSAGSPVRSPWSASVGVRYNF